jgi:hypothetical protein
LHEEKTLPYPGFKLGTFGFQVGNATNQTVEVSFATLKILKNIISDFQI